MSMSELALTQEDIAELCSFSLRGYRYEFFAGEQRKDGKFPLYVKTLILVQNGNRSYWSRRTPKKLWREYDNAQSSVKAMNEAVYVLNRHRNGK
jgi:hypothetical protein